MICTFRVKGYLNANWADYFPGFSMRTLPEKETLFNGWVPDQPAFMGILNQVHNFGLVLLYVYCLADEINDTAPASVDWNEHGTIQ